MQLYAEGVILLPTSPTKMSEEFVVSESIVNQNKPEGLALLVTGREGP
jgi:hypothetical protein